jgi:transcriptional regulator with XRE-family HTH domain
MNLIQERKKLGLSQKKAAKKIGISQSMLAMIESGDRSGSDETKKKIAKFYKTTVGILFFNDEVTKRDYVLHNKSKETI